MNSDKISLLNEELTSFSDIIWNTNRSILKGKGLIQFRCSIFESAKEPSQRYDPKNKEKTYQQSKYDILLQKVIGKGRNLGNINFAKKTYYKSTKGDFLLFPDS